MPKSFSVEILCGVGDGMEKFGQSAVCDEMLSNGENVQHFVGVKSLASKKKLAKQK